MKSGSMSSFESARNIEDVLDERDDWATERPLDKTEDAMPPDSESYHAHIRAAALACHCCPVCCSPPCDGCLAGGVCDDADCRCDYLDDWNRRDEEDSTQ
jgi:hypothetical protein